MELAERIVVCGRIFRDDLARQAGRWQLSEPEFLTLWVCRRVPPSGLGQNELAARLAVSAAQVSSVVEQLRRQRFLVGRRAKTDRRRKLWRLTPAGRAKLQAVLADLADWAGPLGDQLVTEDSHALVRLLDRLAEMLRTRAEKRQSTKQPPERLAPRAAHRATIDHDTNRKGAA